MPDYTYSAIVCRVIVKLQILREKNIMATITFDTLKFANKLKSAGVLPEQAQAEAEALSEVFEINLKELSTQQDMKLLVASLKCDIAGTKAGLIR